MSKLLLDSDFLIANYRVDDPLHKQAAKLSRKLNKEGHKYYCLNLVVQESTTVVSNKMGMDDVRKFYRGLDSVVDKFILLDQELEDRSWKIFLKLEKKGTSFIDCVNLAAIEKYKLDGILTFDRFYPKGMRKV